jgi:hypothetical protein
MSLSTDDFFLRYKVFLMIRYKLDKFIVIKKTVNLVVFFQKYLNIDYESS